VSKERFSSTRFRKGSPATLYWGAAILLLLAFFAQLAFGSRRLSLTSDELPHLGAGYTYLTTGETWHIPALGNPPLLLAWIAWPVVLSNPHVPLQTLPNWHTDALPPYFRALLPLLGPVEQLEVAGRVPVMLLGVVLGSLVFRWAADLFGYQGGLLALALMAFDPTMLAHAQLATIDVGVTLLGLATFFVGWRWLRAGARPVRAATGGWGWAIAMGLLAGATLAAKVSGVIWVGLAVSIKVAVELVRARRSWPRALGPVVARGAVILAVAFLVLWGIYGFRVGPVHVGPYALTVPAADHWEALRQQTASPAIRLMFLAGETRVGGWWWYFPFAFLIKNPLPLLVIWSGAIVVSVWRRTLGVADYLFLLAFPVVYVATAMVSKMNIGYRHLLPIHPFLYVLAGQWVSVGVMVRMSTFPQSPIRNPQSAFRIPWARGLWAAVWIWYIVGTVGIFPHYLAYFNELVGGARNGYRYLVDSNLDWGQSFKALKADLERLDVRPPLRLGHYWYAGPELYGVQYEPLPPLPGAPPVFSPRFDPPPGTYVLGATLLYRGAGDLEQYEWFKHHTPLAQPGYALFVFRVDPPQPPATWIAQCTQPAPPLEPAVISKEFDTRPLRRVYFDCTQSWVYPEGGRTSGWYALHDRVLQEETLFLQQHLDQAHLAYVHHQYDAMAPAFRLYEFRPSMQAMDVLIRDVPIPDVPIHLIRTVTSTVWVAPPGMGPAQVMAEQPAVTAPLHLEGPLTFLGYRLLKVRSEEVDLETWWKVTERQTRVLSIMAHLVRDDGVPIGVADGLGVPVETWQVGDVLVQVHRFSWTPDMGGERGERAWLQTGVYWLDTLERQKVMVSGQDVGDRILLGEIRLADGPDSGVLTRLTDVLIRLTDVLIRLIRQAMELGEEEGGD